MPPQRHHLSRRQAPFAQLHAAATVANIEPQGNTFRIRLPKAKSARPGLNPVPVGSLPRRRQEIPWHDAISSEPAPFQVAVGALPMVAEKARTFRQRAPPAQPASAPRRLRGDATERSTAVFPPSVLRFGRRLPHLRPPASADLDKRDAAGPLHVGRHKIGRPDDVYKGLLGSGRGTPLGAWTAAMAATPVPRNSLRDFSWVRPLYKHQICASM